MISGKYGFSRWPEPCTKSTPFALATSSNQIKESAAATVPEAFVPAGFFAHPTSGTRRNARQDKQRAIKESFLPKRRLRGAPMLSARLRLPHRWDGFGRQDGDRLAPLEISRARSATSLAEAALRSSADSVRAFVLRRIRNPRASR